jgi:hypothetical protein
MRLIIVIAIAALALASGCSVIPGVAQVQGAFVVGTEKTIEDHVISLSSGKNCSSVRREQGMTYCVEDEKQVKQNIYCYQTLGSVTCYDRPDPHGGRQKQLGVDETNVAK